MIHTLKASVGAMARRMAVPRWGVLVTTCGSRQAFKKADTDLLPGLLADRDSDAGVDG